LVGSTRGRRPGRPETRAEILAVARRRFLAQGYQAVTMRAVAEDAGVDAALISYFFGSKKGLFGATLALSANPPEILLGARCPATLQPCRNGCSEPWSALGTTPSTASRYGSW